MNDAKRSQAPKEIPEELKRKITFAEKKDATKQGHDAAENHLKFLRGRNYPFYQDVVHGTERGVKSLISTICDIATEEGLVFILQELYHTAKSNQRIRKREHRTKEEALDDIYEMGLRQALAQLGISRPDRYFRYVKNREHMR